MTSPDTFVLNDEDGQATVGDPHVPAAKENEVRAAAATCPEQAITIEQDD